MQDVAIASLLSHLTKRINSWTVSVSHSLIGNTNKLSILAIIVFVLLRNLSCRCLLLLIYNLEGFFFFFFWVADRQWLAARQSFQSNRIIKVSAEVRAMIQSCPKLTGKCRCAPSPIADAFRKTEGSLINHPGLRRNRKPHLAKPVWSINAATY